MSGFEALACGDGDGVASLRVCARTTAALVAAHVHVHCTAPHFGQRVSVRRRKAYGMSAVSVCSWVGVSVCVCVFG